MSIAKELKGKKVLIIGVPAGMPLLGALVVTRKIIVSYSIFTRV